MNFVPHLNFMAMASTICPYTHTQSFTNASFYESSFLKNSNAPVLGDDGHAGGHMGEHDMVGFTHLLCFNNINVHSCFSVAA